MQLAIFAALCALASSVSSAPILRRPRAVAAGSIPIPGNRAATAGFFKPQAFNAFTISGGTAGTSEARAKVVFFAPLDGLDLKTVSQTDLATINTMARAAVDAEETFNSAIDAASGTAADALQNGKIANKVLKLIGQNAVLAIKSAQGDATAETKLEEEATKLAKNIQLDVAQAGKPMTAISFAG